MSLQPSLQLPVPYKHGFVKRLLVYDEFPVYIFGINATVRIDPFRTDPFHIEALSDLGN